MPAFSKISLERLQTAHVDLQVLFAEVIKGYDCSIVCGFRGEEEQDDAFLSGASTVKWPNSKHNSYPSMAVDAAPYENGIDWSREQGLFFAGFVKGVAEMLYRDGRMKHKLRLGSDWDNDNDVNDEKFFDTPHFELIK